MCRYSSLRVNLPRHIMSFSDFPFIPAAMGGRSTDARTYCHHSEVMATLPPPIATFLQWAAVHVRTPAERLRLC